MCIRDRTQSPQSCLPLPDPPAVLPEFPHILSYSEKFPSEDSDVELDPASDPHGALLQDCGQTPLKGFHLAAGCLEVPEAAG